MPTVLDVENTAYSSPWFVRHPDGTLSAVPWRGSPARRDADDTTSLPGAKGDRAHGADGRE